MHGSNVLYAAELPGTVDAGRIQTKNYTPAPAPSLKKDITPSHEKPNFLLPPDGADKTMLVMRDIKIEGSSVYTKADLQSLYQNDLGKKVPLSRLWDIANAITQKYREDGYFLSRAYIPQQEIAGVPRIAIVEGYISEVELSDQWKKVGLVQKAISDIQLQKRVRLSHLEEMLLRLNDLPGARFASILGVSKIQPKGEGGVKLTLRDIQKSEHFTASVSNYGSKYLGPVVANLNWHGIIIPHQETQANITITPDRREVKAVTLSHRIPVSLRDNLMVTLDTGKSVPGDNLRVQDIDSKSTSLSIAWEHNWVYTRKLELSSNLGFRVRHSIGHILGSVLSEDDIRDLSLGFSASGSYFLGEYSADIGIVKGLPVLGGSNKNDQNLSRPHAGTDFQKVTADLQTNIPLGANWTGLIRTQGQLASRSLPSSEEFGFGGPVIGRGYDDSELTGDNGIASTLELSYMGLLSSSSLIALRPYTFYDAGKVWNINAGQVSNLFASSAGVGVAAFLNGKGIGSGWQSNFYIASPLTKAIDNPQQGGGNSLQFRFQLSRQF